MPPRIPLFQCLRVAPAPPSTLLRPFSSTPCAAASKPASQRKPHRDPYAIAATRAKKAANISRRNTLNEQRTAALGDPVLGIETPFLRSFDTATAADSNHVNFFISKADLEAGIEHSQALAQPPDEKLIYNAADTRFGDDSTPQSQLNKEQEVAREALMRITSLDIGSSADRHRVNIQRCIDTFGRHNTANTLPPPLLSAARDPEKDSPKMQRAGPDTGSSEVQIAILTAKIRTLAEFMKTRGKGDKANKRNLRLLVHRRQKLLVYLQRKEHGGPRWRHCIETLGLTEGTWRGEISL